MAPLRGMAKDVDISRIVLHGRKLDARVRDALLDATVRRAMTGASTLTMTLSDPERDLVQSTLFNQATRLELDGLHFQQVKLGKSGSRLPLTYETQGVVALRRQKGFLTARKGTSSRTDFARRLVDEVRYLKFQGDPGDPNLVALTRGGKDDKTESSWDAMTRLAGDRAWRCFENEETIWFGSDDWLAGKGAPLVIRESDPGIQSIDFDADEGKRAQTVTVTCFMHRWAARPGYPVQVRGLGDVVGEGIWLVDSLERSLFKTQGTVSLVRKTRELPEPKPDAPSSVDGGVTSVETGTTAGGEADGWRWPADGVITGRFGDDRGDHAHAGLDIAAPTGTPVYAARSGVVTFAGVADGYGNVIYLGHDSGFGSRYAHLSSILVPGGKAVSAGDLIGRVGSTGDSTGPHLHFEISVGGVAKDPLLYLP